MEKILITTSSFGKADSTVLDLFAANHLEPVLNPHGRKLTEDEVAGLLRESNPIGMVAGVEPLTAQALGASDRLRVISRCGIGLDNVDLTAARELGIRVFNTPEAPTAAVAELTIGLMLSVLRGIPAADAAIRAGEWVRPSGRLLSALTVGIIGCGRIGSAVATILEGFGSRVIGCDLQITDHDRIDTVDLKDVLSEADVITLHLPYGPGTHHLIGQDEIGRMKPEAILINASRGGLVDETALEAALGRRLLAGAGIDCFESEPYEGPLTKRRNVVLTSHIGSYAREARARMESEAVENLLTGLQEGS